MMALAVARGGTGERNLCEPGEWREAVT
jgi:hypothetical protein